MLCAVLIAAAAAGGVGMVQLQSVDEAGGGIYERNLLPIDTLARVDGDVNEILATILRHVISTGTAEKQDREQEISVFQQHFEQMWAEYTASVGTTAEQMPASSSARRWKRCTRSPTSNCCR
ncbi:MCP four helix bundle domain-containing protein [Actinoplanes sp. NPDC026670]|uniref:MCP four helix bundle domain-containing protein n=1 Tax=Actinoplanes sp. NPDC026670 TaxID=3154700 RepID=UPI0033EB6D03